MTYQNYKKNYYQPRKPVKSFQDLEVYQKVANVAVVVTKRVLENLNKKNKKEDEKIEVLAGKLIDHLLTLPVMLASGHSMRFSYPAEAVKKLEEAMLYCNLSAVYLEQYRDLGNHEIEPEFFEEQIKTLLATRGKIMRLQLSWKKFYSEKKS